MAVVRVSTEQKGSSPPVLPDDRFAIRFAACGIITLIVVCGGCFAIALGWVPGSLQTATFWTCLLAGLAGVGAALAPLFFGLHCRGCARRIYPAKAKPHGHRPAIHFYCPACRIEWDTGFWWGEE